MLARDRLGIKPLYYAQRNDRCIFASEIKAIRTSGLVSVSLNQHALAAFLRLGSVPGPMTAFEGVQELPPASILVVGEKADGEVHPYWEVPTPEPQSRDTHAAVEELRERLRDSVACHLVSDVPLGVFLSGGVDSGAIVAMMREAGYSRVRTFSITFRETDFDEGPDVARIAARYSTEHTARRSVERMWLRT